CPLAARLLLCPRVGEPDLSVDNLPRPRSRSTNPGTVRDQGTGVEFTNLVHASRGL
ncbi:uncharacterized protein METZ01_LOCUS514842, partial [marine metagenome]